MAAPGFSVCLATLRRSGQELTATRPIPVVFNLRDRLGECCRSTPDRVDSLPVDDTTEWAATKMGIQGCDQAGRGNSIIPMPNGRIANLCFGENFDALFATCGDKVYKRKLKVTGA